MISVEPGITPGIDAMLVDVVLGAGYPRWDINGDGIVDYVDLAILSAHWGETNVLPVYRWDINGDGTADYIDEAILSAHWEEDYRDVPSYYLSINGGLCSNVFTDFDSTIPNEINVSVVNAGDEPVDIECYLAIDSVPTIKTMKYNVLPGQYMTFGATVPASAMSGGTHMVEWNISARATGTTEFELISSEVVAYTIEQPEFDAYCSSVMIVQPDGKGDIPWLAGSSTGFSETSGVKVTENKYASYYFALLNNSEYSVRVYVGYDIGGGTYATGILIDGEPLEMYGPSYVDLMPYTGGTLTTQSHLPAANYGVAFSVLRELI